MSNEEARLPLGLPVAQRKDTMAGAHQGALVSAELLLEGSEGPS